jgi:hypothetical protein
MDAHKRALASSAGGAFLSSRLAIKRHETRVVRADPEAVHRTGSLRDLFELCRTHCLSVAVVVAVRQHTRVAAQCMRAVRACPSPMYVCVCV